MTPEQGRAFATFLTSVADWIETTMMPNLNTGKWTIEGIMGVLVALAEAGKIALSSNMLWAIAIGIMAAAEAGLDILGRAARAYRNIATLVDDGIGKSTLGGVVHFDCGLIWCDISVFRKVDAQTFEQYGPTLRAWVEYFPGIGRAWTDDERIYRLPRDWTW